MSAKDFWSTIFSRAGLRRRLLLFSAPMAVVVIVVLVKMWSVVVAGGAASADFADADVGALRDDVAVLDVLNVAQSENAYFAEGNLAVLENRLEKADAQFSVALARTEPARSCPARINLELVRETLGDRAANISDKKLAIKWYRGALDAISGSPAGCFSGSTDPDEKRRAVLEGAEARLNEKINAVSEEPPPTSTPPPRGSGADSTPTEQGGQQTPTSTPPPPPESKAADSTPKEQNGQQTTPDTPPPPPEPEPSNSTPTGPDVRLRLNPGSGNPLERLQQILQDAATAQNAN